MEAASARYAARDRWGEPGQPAPSQLLRFIQAACSPENYEPNLAVNLEIADLINAKKGSTPREAAIAIVGYINHRNPNVSLLALNLLDICVKNCGYPFHLQIATKDFLNELVRRFPERPPVRPSRVQAKILEAIEEWRGTLCETSRYREDLGFIRDMHRLLSYKGYTFPEVRREDAAVLNPSDNLKSAEEMEEEEREAQSAKLQELIRRGTPEDLREANQLMKVMAGFDTRSKVDYRAKAAEEVGKIQQKARLLEERLEAFKPGDKLADGDVFSELASALSSAQPKIQKMCEEESDDHEAVAKLLEINDSIHRTFERYKLLKKGDVEGAKQIAKGGPVATASAGGSKAAATELSLIDFDDAGANGAAAGQSQAAPQPASIEDDLLGLSLGDTSSYGQAGGIALGFGANTNIPGPALLSSMTQGNTAAPGQPPASTPSPAPFSGFSSFTSAPGSKSVTPQPPQRASFSPPAQPPAASDPFAALASLSPKPATPVPPVATANDDDEWNFSSALPPEVPQEHKALISNTMLKIDMLANRTSTAAPALVLSFGFSNNTASPVSELHFQLAVTKGYELELKPQSGRTLEPKQSHGVTQSIRIWHTGNRDMKVETVKLRWRVSYNVGGKVQQEMGEIPEFTVA
ncbi:VHS domain-containing protein [Staphylotrichum tortipilum]|uniref:VHS domain-containing protein n=1 Tax=Staphylotrichum tortipilum TaxID=2831512 RepID=A0AAN6MDY8_9PEZI|nr:VHS domain-containing protein [Staphylotrichum longicolle]